MNLKRNLKRRVQSLVLRKLFNAVTLDEVLRNPSQGKVSSWAIQAKDYLDEHSLFQELKIEMDRVCEIHMFRNPGNIEFGQAMLYTNDLWEKKIRRLANQRPDEAQRVGRDNK